MIDLALDVRETSHMSVGMLAYARALRRALPRLAPDLRIAEIGGGDNFDLAEQIGIPATLLRLRPRLVHIPTPYVPRLLPSRAVVTVHDLIDLEFPQYAKRAVVPYWDHVIAPVLRRAAAVITDDEVTAGLLAARCGIEPSRVRVIPLGVDAPNPLPAAAVRARPYLFYAGNHRGHKDLATLVRAWALVPERYALDLVLTGKPEPALRSLRRAGGEGVFLGDVDATAVWAHHRGALAYVQPSLREGFGLPLLEALRVGAPAIASDRAAVAALRPHLATYPAGDATALAAAIERVAAAPALARAAAERGRVATAHLTWERTASATIAVYRELLR